LRNALSIALYSHGNPFSVGGIIRVAHSFLVREILLIGEASFYPKASMGMHHYETIRVFPDEPAFLQHVGARPLWAVEKDHATRSLFSPMPFPDDVVLLFGSERAGLPPSMLAHASQVIGIPMYGVNHSFPVSVTVGMVLCEWSRRRYAPGTVVTVPRDATGPAASIAVCSCKPGSAPK
jgi:tRNA G18 (ribose-2'-O)-methylase SpoU